MQADVDAKETTFAKDQAEACTAEFVALPCNTLVSAATGPFVFATPSTYPGLFRFPLPGTACARAIAGVVAPSAV